MAIDMRRLEELATAYTAAWNHHAVTRKFVKVNGWEEWELDDQCRITNSLGWFDAADYERQVSA